MSLIRVAALDGSLRRFGVAVLLLDTVTMEFQVESLHLFDTENSKNKKVRASSDNYNRARSIAVGVREVLKDCSAVFGEVPSGGQSYKAVLGFGIVIGIYASLDQDLTEVSPTETKLAALNSKTASKEEIMEWAYAKFPTAEWLRYTRGGATYKKGDYHSDNEHLADAVAIAHAGVQTPAFKQMLSILRGSLTKAA